jgi:hypothetical protein
MIRLRSVAIFAALLILAAFALNAQVASSVTGTVLDPSGAAIPGATVSLQMPGSGSSLFTAKTTSNGAFSIASVPPNTYDLVVEASGFLKLVVNNIAVEPSRTMDVQTLRLSLPTTSQTVEVSEASVTVQTTSSDVSTTITKTQIQDLPTMNRSPLGFLQSQAGINNARGNTTVNGQRSSYVNVTLDGINIQDNFIRTNDMDFLPNLLLLDQVAEVTVSSSNADASTSGGSSQVNFVTPSGTNQYHGSLYWSNRNSALAANSFFNNRVGTPIPHLNQNQIGGKVGGPVLKNKLFFYFNYEAYRQKQQSTYNYAVLTPNARNGIFTLSNGTQVNVLNLMNVAPNSVMTGIMAKVPTAYNNYNVGDSSSALLRNTAGYQFNVRNNRTRDNITGKLDYSLSTKNSLSASYIYNRDLLDRPDCDTTFDTTPGCRNINATRLFSLGWRYNPLPSLTNEARFGFNLAPGLFIADPSGPGFFVTGTSYQNPINTFLPQGRFTNTYNWSDKAAWIHDAHTVQFGVTGQRVTIRNYNYASILPSYALGFGTGNQGLVASQIPGISSSDLSSANTLLATLAGYLNTDTQLFNVTSRTSGYVNGAPNLRNLYFTNYTAYVTDSWKVKRNLTATLGLHWDHYTPVDEKDSLALLPVIKGNNPIATLLDPNLTLDFAGSAVGRSWYSPSWHNFAPNLGLAWSPSGDNKLAIRAGYSIAYVDDNIAYALSNSAVSTNSGLATTVSNAGLKGFISSTPPALTAPAFQVPRTVAQNYALNPSGNATAMPDPGLTTPYVQQWNLSVERSIKDMLVSVRYVGNHGVKEIRGLDYNQVLISGLLPAFQQAQSNGFLAQKATGSFNPTYNPNIAGSVQIPYFAAMPNGGYLTNSSVMSYLQTGAVGELANFYQYNGINGPYNYYRNVNTLGANMLQNYSTSSYNAGIIELTKRMAHGFSFQANYVFSKVLSDSQGNQGTTFEPLLDMNNPKLEKARVAGMDITQVFKSNFSYELPFGPGHNLKSNAIVNKVISNWNVAGLFTMQSGTPFSILSARGTLNRSARSTNNTASTDLTLSQLKDLFQLRMTGNGPYYVAASAIGSDGRAVAPDGNAAFTGQAFYQPAAGNVGNMQKAILNGPGVWNFDFKVSKDMKITESKSMQIRMDSTNLFNHTTFYVGDQTLTSTTFGKVTSQYYGNRLIQFALYFKF